MYCVLSIVRKVLDCFLDGWVLTRWLGSDPAGCLCSYPADEMGAVVEACPRCSENMRDGENNST